jgi:hypothetical protein
VTPIEADVVATTADNTGAITQTMWYQHLWDDSYIPPKLGA